MKKHVVFSCRAIITIMLCLFLFPADGAHAAAVKKTLPYQVDFASDFPTLDQLSFTDVNQKVTPGSDLIGQAVLILFFDTGCAKCTSKLPTFEKIRKTFEAEGVTFIAYSNSGTGLRNVANSNGYDWIWGISGANVKQQLKSNRNFDIFLFDRTGKIAYRFNAENRKWKLLVELGLGAVLERALDLSGLQESFVGSQMCGMCHPKEYDQWKESDHAGSYASIIDKRNMVRLDCRGCHVTGEVGGAGKMGPQTMNELQEVGCEECHGPGGPHRTKPHPDAALYSTKEESCKRCHDAEKAGCVKSWKEANWDYASALKKVAHAHSADVAPATGEATKKADIENATK